MTFYILIQFLFTYLDAAREFCALCEIATVAICGLSGEASGIGFKNKVNRELIYCKRYITLILIGIFTVWLSHIFLKHTTIEAFSGHKDATSADVIEGDTDNSPRSFTTRKTPPLSTVFFKTLNSSSSFFIFFYVR